MIYTETKQKILKCANDILKRGKNIQELAKEYNVTDRTLYRYMSDYLPQIDMELYNKVINEMDRVRSINMTKKAEERKRKQRQEAMKIGA